MKKSFIRNGGQASSNLVVLIKCVYVWNVTKQLHREIHVYSHILTALCTKEEIKTKLSLEQSINERERLLDLYVVCIVQNQYLIIIPLDTHF